MTAFSFYILHYLIANRNNSQYLQEIRGGLLCILRFYRAAIIQNIICKRLFMLYKFVSL